LLRLCGLVAFPARGGSKRTLRRSPSRCSSGAGFPHAASRCRGHGDRLCRPRVGHLLGLLAAGALAVGARRNRLGSAVDMRLGVISRRGCARALEAYELPVPAVVRQE